MEGNTLIKVYLIRQAPEVERDTLSMKNINTLYYKIMKLQII